MQLRKLSVVRQTKLDLAKWITCGIAQCRNPATAHCLARYAALQLQAAALIPHVPDQATRRGGAGSLLRVELKRTGNPRGTDCFVTLTRVSRAMLVLLAGNSPGDRDQAMRDITIAKLIQHEMQVARLLAEMIHGRSAA